MPHDDTGSSSVSIAQSVGLGADTMGTVTDFFLHTAFSMYSKEFKLPYGHVLIFLGFSAPRYTISLDLPNNPFRHHDLNYWAMNSLLLDHVFMPCLGNALS